MSNGYRLDLEPIPGWDPPPIIRLRAMLKAASRRYGFRCSAITTSTEPGQPATTPPAGTGDPTMPDPNTTTPRAGDIRLQTTGKALRESTRADLEREIAFLSDAQPDRDFPATGEAKCLSDEMGPWGSTPMPTTKDDQPEEEPHP